MRGRCVVAPGAGAAGTRPDPFGAVLWVARGNEADSRGGVGDALVVASALDVLRHTAMRLIPRGSGPVVGVPVVTDWDEQQRSRPPKGPETLGRVSRFRVAEDPRSCGEDGSGRTRSARRDGGPPLVRGGPDVTHDLHKPCRRTPAHAGRTPACSPPAGRSRGDPRSCGDDCLNGSHRCTVRGGPPLVRGRRVRAAVGAVDDRRTPARAGTTRRPPRRHDRCPGTPARAGTTAGSSMSRPAMVEDPRSCGDDAR